MPPEGEIAPDPSVGGSTSDPGLLPGDGGGEPTGPVDLEAVAAAFDAEAVGGADPAHPEEGSDPGKDGTAAAAGTPPPTDPIDEYINRNYQGNRDAFLASQYESRQETLRLATEIEILKRERTATPPRDLAAELKALRASDPDVQALDQEIASISQETRGIELRQLEIAKEANTLQTTIVQLEAQIPTLTDEPKELAKAQSTLYRARTELSSIKAEYDTNEARRAVNHRDARRLSRELTRAERDLRSSMDAQERQARDADHNADWTRGTFETAFQAQVEKYGLDPKSERYVFVREAARTMLADYLQSLGDEHPGLDGAGINSAVSKLTERYAKAHGIQPRSARPTPRTPPPAPTRRQVVAPAGQRSAVANPDPTSPSPPRPRTSDDVLSTPDLVRQRARAIFNAAGQSRGLRGRGLA